LGGGLAIGEPLWGASVDSVLGIDVVSTWLNNSADWSVMRINATNEPDLYWGMLVRHRITGMQLYGGPSAPDYVKQLLL